MNDKPPVRCVNKNNIMKKSEFFEDGVIIDPLPLSNGVDFNTLLNKYQSALIGYKGKLCMLNNPQTIDEARAFVISSQNMSISPSVLFTTDDEWYIPGGTHILCCLLTLQSMGLSSLYITSKDYSLPAELVEKLVPYSKIPLFYKGQDYDGLFVSFPQITEKEIAEDVYLVSTPKNPAYLSPDADFSPPIACSEDMSGSIMECENEAYDILSVELQDPEDTYFLLHNLYMFTLPLCITCNNINNLELVAKVYSGRLLIDRRSNIDEINFKNLSEKYGAIIV